MADKPKKEESSKNSKGEHLPAGVNKVLGNVRSFLGMPPKDSGGKK